MSGAPASACRQSATTCAYAAQALAPFELAAAEAHIAGCAACQRELDVLSPVLEHFVAWPTDLLRPPHSLKARLAERVGEGGAGPRPWAGAWAEPEWETVAPGIECKLLASDRERSRVSMLVRLAPGASYPPHTHADVEELHLLHGELWIDDRKLHPGDYNWGAPGASDQKVWSETGCTCVLVTSTRDVLAS
jgi:anti-sigma factor ChrR (cupin superfamily)